MKKTVRRNKPVQKTRTATAKARPPARKAVPAKRKPARRTMAFETQLLPLQMLGKPAPTLTFPAPTPAPATMAAAPKTTPEDLRGQIEREAYFLAEKDGFRGDPSGYWMEAESRIMASVERPCERISCTG